MKMKHRMFLALAVGVASSLCAALVAPAQVPPVTPAPAPVLPPPSPVFNPVRIEGPPPIIQVAPAVDAKVEAKKKKEKAALEKKEKAAADRKTAADRKASDKAKEEDRKQDKEKEKANAKGKAPSPAKPGKMDSASASRTTAGSLSPGPAVARERNVNLRGQPAINSEIVTHIKRGELVTVLEEITLKKAKDDEPVRWAKVNLPPGTVVWVSSHFIKADTKEVIPKRLNLRSGPGENFSILGRVDKGAVLKEVETKGEWVKVEAPTNCYAFIAAHLLSTDPADVGPALAKASPPAPPPAPTTTTEVAARSGTVPALPLTGGAPAATLPSGRVNPPRLPAPPAPTPGLVVAAGSPQPPIVRAPPAPRSNPVPPPAVVEPVSPPVVVTVQTVPVEDSNEKRIVTREGVVRGSASIQAPTYFVLRDLDNNKTINYIHAPTNVVMRGFNYHRVIVTGEEILDERWPHTPVINVDEIKLVPVP